MKKAIKLVAISAAVVAAGAVATAVVSAWGDNSGGRRTYTIAEIDKGALGDKVVFNSIKDDSGALHDGTIKDERNFVAARDKSTGNNGVKNVWQNNEITVEEGKTYIVRLYVHNNNPKGTKVVAKDVTTNFSLGTVVSAEQRVDGYINSSNATPSKYWDDVVFKSADGRKFYLDYVEGSALLENNGVGKNGGVKLSDDVVTSGTKIGYESLNGEVPGCYSFDNYVTIEVKPVFESTEIEKTVRKLTDEKFSETVTAEIGETVEYQIHYKNTNNTTVKDVTLRDSLPTNMEYVKGSTVLYNSNHPKGTTYTDDKLTTTGINIGSYKVNGSAYVRFRAVVKNVDLQCGSNRLINWAKAVNQVGVSTNVNYFAVQDSAIVLVNRKCEEPKTYVCQEVNGQYWGKDGKIVDKATYEKECTTPKTYTCKEVDGQYWGKDGKVVDKATYEKECLAPKTHKCEIVDFVFYGKDGKIVDKATYEKECTTPKTYTCKEVDGQYWGKDGKVVDKATYEKECLAPKTHKCEIVDFVFYGKDGNVVDKETYEKECTTPKTHKCETINNVYYGKNGNVVDEATYKTECVGDLPDTGASSIATGVLGLGGTVTVAGYYIASRKQLR